MGVQDMDTIFQLLDPRCRGYLTGAQVGDFYATLQLGAINQQHVEAAIAWVCGGQANCTVTKDRFAQVLQEVERRHQLEEEAMWNFRALDRNASHRLSLSDALLLMQQMHGTDFSMATWQQFLAARPVTQSDVSFDEMKPWLCAPPGGSPSDVAAAKAEQHRLTELKTQQAQQEFEMLRQKELQKGDAQQRQDYEDKTRRLARRKLNRWEEGGIEALLYDDGVDDGSVASGRASSQLRINDILDALQAKYDGLRKKLMMEMLSNSESMWSALSDYDQNELYQALAAEEKALRKDNKLAEGCAQLLGAEIGIPSSLHGMMGDLRNELAQSLSQLSQRQLQLSQEGISSEQVVVKLRQECRNLINVKTTSGQILSQLHERFNGEKEYLLSVLRAANEDSSRKSPVYKEYARLQHQRGLYELEEMFPACACAMGLAERPQRSGEDSFLPDRLRQESLARGRLFQRKGRKLNLPAPIEAAVNTNDLIGAQVNVVQEITWKHAQEREFLIHVLTGQELPKLRASAQQLDEQSRGNRITSLRNQRVAWRNSSREYMTTQQNTHMNILTEGIGLYFENRWDQMGEEQEEVAVCASVLADLQEKQDQEFDGILEAIENKDVKGLSLILSVQQQARRLEHHDLLASLILGTFELTEEEKPFIKALEEKYDMLSQVLLMHDLKCEIGIAWDRMPVEEKQRLFLKKRRDEASYRQEGRMEALAQLTSNLPEQFPSMRALLGESRSEYYHRQKVLMAKQEQEAYAGRDFTLLESDEVPADEIKSLNPLADLVQRFYAEQDALISMLRSTEVMAMSPRQRGGHLAMLKMEKRLVEAEAWFDQAAGLLGLRERVEAVTERRHRADQNRQWALAVQMLILRQERIESGKAYSKQLDEYARPEKGDISAWEDAYLKELCKKHYDEVEVLMGLLQDASIEELREVARTMDNKEQNHRLEELRNKRAKLQLKNKDDRDENTSILEEAAAIRSVLKWVQMAPAESELTWDKVAASLLVDLFHEQDKEVVAAVQALHTLDEKELYRAREYEINMRHWAASDNVLQILTKYQGTGEDEQLLKALEEKYDSLRDKLLSDALMRQLGEAEWQALSEQERQRRLMMLKLKEKQLRKQGKYDELAALLGEGWANEEALRKLMGDNRAEYERKLQERLARRQKRIEQGLDPDEGEEDLLEEEDEDSSGGDPLSQLYDRFAQDKDALLARLRGMSDDSMSERERQAELVRLRREKLLAQREDNFENAALLIGLSERQQAEAAERLKNDRARQEQLAKERLEAMRRKRGEKQAYDDTVVTSGDITVLQDAVMQRLSERQSEERQLLGELMDSYHGDEQKIAETMTETERQERIKELRSLIDNADKGNPEHYRSLLQEACHLKMASCQHKDAETNLEQITVTLMADLQEKQNAESAALMDSLPDKDPNTLASMQAKLIAERNCRAGDSIVAIVTALEESGSSSEEEVLDALESKYDALRDKLLAEALIQQMGESNWQNMSEKDRQRKLLELKLEERRLRQEGKMDEAAALLGESIRNHESLEKLLGENKAERERRLKERLEKRRQRKEQGMTDEECDALEAEEEEEEKKRRNILADLQHNYDQEREELLKRLRAGSDQEEAERQRQLEMLRLRREQRRAKQEDKFDAAALVLGLAQDRENVAAADRTRQEQLARERLAARRNKVKATEEAVTEAAVPEDCTDVVQIQEALVKEIEMKHAAERDLMIQMLESAGPTQQLAAGMGAEGREAKLYELRELRQQWRASGAQDAEQQKSILQEGAGFRMEVIRSELGAAGQPSTDDVIQVSLLADLQQRQDAELSGVVGDMKNKPAEALLELKSAHLASRQNQWLDNAAAVLLGEASPVAMDTGLSTEEQEIVQELEKKYDAVRDKLLTEALLQNMGEAEWAALSERERQAKLMQLKLQEKKLRQEGRLDEAAVLLGQLQDSDAELKKKLGDSRAEQQRKMEERLKRRRELQEERAAKGLSTDDAVLDAIQEQEEAEKEEDNKENVLASLQHHFEDEKEALLAALRGQGNRQEAERQRQLELALLKREQKKLQQEDKFDSAAILLSMADQHERNRKDKFDSERDRQRELARQRLEARRNKTSASVVNTSLDQAELEEALKEQLELNKREDALLATEEHKPGASVLQDSLLSEVEKRQSSERDMLLELLAAADNSPQAKIHADSMTMQEIKTEMDRLRVEQTQWHLRSRQAAYRAKETKDEAVKKQHLAESAELQAEQFKLLIKAAAMKVRVTSDLTQKTQSDLTSASLSEEVQVSLLAELQEMQLAESHALEKVILDHDEELLTKLRDSQRLARQEGWRENLNRTLFHWPSEMDSSGDEEEGEERPDSAAVKEELEKEFEHEKEELQDKLKESGPDADLEAALKELEAQQEAKRKALSVALERQREQVRKKLEAKRQAKEYQEYEQDAAAHLINMASEQNEALAAKTTQEKGRQQDLMQERLAQRRAARKQKEDEEKAKNANDSYPAPRRTSVSEAMFPPGLRRERTALDTEVSDLEKKQIYDKLVRQQTDLHRRMSIDQRRQQEALERRLRERKVKRNDEAAALFSLGERQKTILQKSQEDERERQLAAMKERVERVRYERTMTMKEKSNQKKGFSDVVQDDETKGMTEDEKMALAAKKMQEKFSQEEKNVKEGKKSVLREESETSLGSGSVKPAPKVDKMELLKQKRAQKKAERQAKQLESQISEEGK